MRIIVQTRSLDSLLRAGTISSPDVIKIDVEGAEEAVLNGARHILEMHKPSLFIEAHSRDLAKRCSSILLKLKYEITVLETGAPVDGVTEPEVCHLEARPR